MNKIITSSHGTVEGEEICVVDIDVRQLLPDSLTEAERDVALHVLMGCTDEEIAERRGTTTKTVSNQVSSVLERANVGSRFEFARYIFALSIA